MTLTKRVSPDDLRDIVRRFGTIVGVWAHPDDEAYLSAGFMAAAVEAGNRVVCVTATRGEHGTSDPARWPPARLARVRERETHAELHRRLPIFGPEGPPVVEPGRLAIAIALRGNALDRKIGALLAHTSQTAELVAMMGDAEYRAWAADEYFADL